MEKSIMSALSALEENFVQFKDYYQSQMDKYTHLEPTWNQKMAEIQHHIHSTDERLNKMEIAIKRPMVAIPSHGSSTERQAFAHFIRKGIEGLDGEHKAMISQNDSQGGFLVPPMMVELIHNKLTLLSPLRQLARTAKISGNSFDILIEKGEAEVGWVAETQERDETATPELVKLRIPVHQIYAKPKVSQILLDDSSFDIEQWLSEKIAQKMAQVENQAFLFGDGKNKPKGILSYPFIPFGKGEWGKWETLFIKEPALKSADFLINIFHGLKAQYLSGASWLMSRKFACQLRQLKDLQGQYLWQPSLRNDDPNRLLGYPIYFSDDLEISQEEAEKGDKQSSETIIFGNFSQAYQIVERSHIQVLRDPFSAKPYVEFYTTKRIGGDVINFEALKMIQFSES